MLLPVLSMGNFQTVALGISVGVGADRARNGHLRIAVLECAVGDRFNRIGNGNVFQRYTARKGKPADRRDPLRYGY